MKKERNMGCLMSFIFSTNKLMTHTDLLLNEHNELMISVEIDRLFASLLFGVQLSPTLKIQSGINKITKGILV